MDIQVWAQEPFLKSLTQNQKVEIISMVIAEYLAKRNIQNDDKQFQVILSTVLEWCDRPGNGYVKPCFLRWALATFHDVRNNNISAFILVEYLRLGYKHETHRNIVMQWEQAQEASRIPEKPVSVLNAESRELAWNKIREMVLSGQIDYSSPWWLNAIKYLANDLNFKAEKKYIEKMHEKAKNIYIFDLEKQRQQTESKTEIQEIGRILDKVKSGGQSEGLDLLRRKLIVEEFIKNQI
jgi:hypothetical protein